MAQDVGPTDPPPLGTLGALGTLGTLGTLGARAHARLVHREWSAKHHPGRLHRAIRLLRRHLERRATTPTGSSSANRLAYSVSTPRSATKGGPSSSSSSA